MLPAKNKSSCAICGCTANKQQRPRQTRVFYRFPKVRDIAKKWIYACDFQNMDFPECDNEDYFYRNRYVICSDHFESIWFKNKHLLSKGLIKGAVPTKNLNSTRRKIESCLGTPIEVKIKVEHQTCHGCFSADRRTSPLGVLAQTLTSLLGPSGYNDPDITELCWECMALLRKVHSFRRQLEYAQSVMRMNQENLSLSSLHISIKDYFDQEIQYNEDFEEKNTYNSDKQNHTDKTSIKKEENNITDFASNENGITDFLTPENGITDFLTPENGIIGFPTPENGIVASPTVNNITESATALEASSDELIKTVFTEYKEFNAINTVKKKKIKSGNAKILYKPYANIIQHSKTDWEKPYNRYYTEIQLDEADIETYFLTKERKRTPDKMIFKCEECALSYSRNMDLDRHNNLNHHQPNTPYKCLHCKEIQPCMDSLKAHWRSHSVFYKCTLCCGPLYVWRYSLALHLFRTHATVYACTNCKSQFSSLQAFAEHYNKNHPFICDYCNKRCALGSVLEKHIRRIHTPKKCTICELTFPTSSLYRKHVTSRHPKVSAKPELSYCVECDKQYPNRVLYLKHVNYTHAANKRPYKSVPCPECGKCFAKNSNMVNHYNFFHVKVTKFRCDLCDKYFLKGYGLRTHMQSVHLKIPKPKNKICDLCGRPFHTATMLANHRRTHTGERPFQCAYCPAAFAQKGAMKIHQLKQHTHT